MRRQFQQFVEFQLHADLGTHSAHYAADRGPSQVQCFDGCRRACCCATTRALVGAR